MRIALYARVSTEEQSLHGLSIDAQLAALREWAGDQAVGEYVDAGISARKAISKRPELQRLLRDVEAGKVDLVAFTKLDRWTRNIREFYKAQDVLDAHGVAWRAIHEDYETETAAGRLKTNIMLSVAQDEADRTSERVKAVFAEKRRKGLVVTGHVPPGISVKDGRLIPNDDAEKVRELFVEYIACRSLSKLSQMEILGRRYTSVGLKNLLSNEKYLATGIIDQGTFETVQNILSVQATRTGRTGRVYLFSGLIVCPVCGAKLTVRTHIEKGVPYVYYRCDKYLDGRRCTWGKSVTEKKLEKYLLRRILPVVEGYNAELTRKKAKPVDVASLQRKLDKLTDLYLSDMIEKDELEKRAAPLRDAIKKAKTAPKAIERAEIVSALDVYPSLTKAAQKAFWSALIKRITPTEEGFSVEIV